MSPALVQVLFALGTAAATAKAQVLATGPMGATNPPAPVFGTPINQNSDARLLSLNAIDDWCVFAPQHPGEVIEGEVVAWCTQPRNNARVIPDGTVTSAHFVKTPVYWQIQGFGDFTKLNIAAGDAGGELDPHGATNLGNPVGGNVTTTATGPDVSYEEWMNYMSYNQFCLRICIGEGEFSASTMCQHTLDLMGCQWVMPGDYTDNSFTECDGDAAIPPGLYPLPGGGYSTFQQRYTGTYTNTAPDGVKTTGVWTQGETTTPAAPATTPKTSNCKTYSTISNGIPLAQLAAGGAYTGTRSSAVNAQVTSVAPTGPTPSVNITVVNSTVVGANGTTVVNSTLSSTVFPTSTSQSLVIVTVVDSSAGGAGDPTPGSQSGSAAPAASSRPSSGALRAAASGVLALAGFGAAALIIL
ncbi:hypothetical protein Q8F55_002423 [Vanrija albida]|uniref:Uncharacterized protein n=1 Tax=Vanrija albida TaxID=181172 RepID=A0ABR3QAB8_9TREE